MVRLAVTGGIAEGKTTVLAMLRSQGAITLESDTIAREVTRPGTDLWEQLVRTFGAEILSAGERIDRERLAARVFADPHARRQLNRLVHPVVWRVLRARVEACPPQAVVAVEVPLLIEAALQGWFDRVLVVYASPETQRRRLRARGLPPERVEALLRAQLPTRAKLPFADWVVRTDRPLRQVERQIGRIWVLLQMEPGVENNGQV